tara:strand:- start:223 stop:519 length:297 start_codon:yes stop_codon:yes gene_type:complete
MADEIEEVEEVEEEVEEAPAEPEVKKVPAKKKAPAKKAVVVEETVTVEPNTVRGRVKGTWRMYYSGTPYDFVDGEYYELPTDLYNYLKSNGNIYDTLA